MTPISFENYKLKIGEAQKTTDLMLAINEFDNFLKNEANVNLETKSFGLSANITIDQIELYLKKYAYLNELKLNTVQGLYDSHFENIQNFKSKKIENIIFIHLFDNILPSLESRLDLLSTEEINNLLNKFENELRALVKEASSFKNIFIPLFFRITPRIASEALDKVDLTLEVFNNKIREIVSGLNNIKLLNFEQILTEFGFKQNINLRFYYNFKAPFTNVFLDQVAKTIFIHLRGGGKYFYKVLVLDCDNTLWGGIIGEDSINGIKLDPYDYPGNIYWYIQNKIINLKKQGVLIALCSKNNAKDVDEVLANHKNMVIRDSDVVLKKVNWQDKASNIREIAKELNLGLDSFVFIDDSEFEISSIKTQLPQVKCIQVPKAIFEYPNKFNEVLELFSSIEQKSNSSDKTLQYQIRAQALSEQAQFATQEEYLKSLQLKITINSKNLKQTPRISELTQKSNQFNVTTRRYTTQEIDGIFNSDDKDIFTVNVTDKFGDSGLTGIVITKIDKKAILIDSFLMSCRVIGRGVEFAIWDYIFESARKRGCEKVYAEYIESPKNALVEDFYDKLGLNLVRTDLNDKKQKIKYYELELESYKPSQNKHIEVICE